MTEYIHSGIAGKINRIVKPHIGNILVTSEFGNAKESTLTEDILKTAVNDINRIKYAVTYKGEKATIDALPTTGNTQGDMWNIAENGHNYAWTGSEWDDLGGTVVSGGNSEWSWNPTPVYEETLSTAYTYAYDEMANSYPLPNTIFGNGLEAIRINIQTPYGTTFAGAPFYFLRVSSLYQNPNFPTTVVYPRITFNSADLIRSIDFEYQIIKGIGTITSKANKDIGSFTNPVIINISEFWPPHAMSEPGIAPKIFGFAFSGTDLPVGSTIKVYIPNNFTTN